MNFSFGDIYPSLMMLPDLSPDKRAEVARQAGEQMTNGIAGLSDAVDRRPFNLPEIIEQTYAHDRMQSLLFVALNLGSVLLEVETWLASDDYPSLA